MNRNVLIQFFLLLTILVTCIVFYILFFKNSGEELKNVKKNKQINNVLLDDPANQMTDIIYNSNYLDKNKYIIKAEFGTIKQDDPDVMLLTNVKSTIFLKNSEIIKISSKKANYNSLNYNTNFYQNVLITFNDHKIISDNFDLFFDKEISTVYNNVIYNNLSTTLHADKIDIDLITKDSKIYMLNNSKKIIIKNLN